MTPALKIYLGDLRYFTGGTCFPLGIGYLAAYARQRFGARVEISMFIDPTELAETIRRAPPDLLGLANYSWNRNINIQLAAHARECSPESVVVMGGPCFARDDQPWLDEFFARAAGMDAYVAGAGEFAFAELIELMLASAPGTCRQAVYEGAFPGLFIRTPAGVREGGRTVDALLRRSKDLDELPSPYLTGLMDPYFKIANLGPMVETVRGCPYACTFCCWGSRLLNKVSSFSVGRAIAEIDYIAQRSANSSRLFFGDANFGLLPRDVEIARHVHDMRERTGWPDKLYLYFAKNSGDRVIDVARLLRDMTKVSLARQSMTEAVLANTKRANLDDETYARIQVELGAGNVESMVEIIYPLPGETRQSFIQGLDRIFRQADPLRTEIRLYPTELLPGSELASTESREKYGLKTGWRRLWGQSGIFAGIPACEYQEIVVATDDFTMEDQAYVRKLHFLVGVFLTYRLFDDVTVLYDRVCGDRGIMALFDRLAEMDDPDLRPLLQAFEHDTAGEFVFGPQPSADGRRMGTDGRPEGDSLAGSIDQQKRYNIHYAIALFFERGGIYRAAMGRALRRIMVEEMGVAATVFDAALAAVEAKIIDYPAIAAALGSHTDLQETRRHPAIDAFVENYDGDVVSSLYGIYGSVGAGSLDALLLDRTRAASPPATPPHLS
ncbi:Fe-S oxidoreductase [Paramagnetospirillum magnetotacticum MS-1]|uniref:Fe-S oxidoreductase n=1 Tax=Paramagnetospirillum magnetotacticum MS-1 TaxID=272627 RepID=A0A0C2YSU1_PARME|nr:B12-binding domain-containing radical SAM protein [Paramagnetospirillum magnetotacticum]KIL97790.1 Fe-S oxidoreductase [Paramagnetospirillum magnetotacticum MS-1]